MSTAAIHAKLQHAYRHLVNSQATLDSAKHDTTLTDPERTRTADLAWQASKLREALGNVVNQVQSRVERKEVFR